MAGHVVATVDELPPGGRKIVRVEGRSIGVFNVDGSFYALRNRCPHQGGPLCLGELFGALDSDSPGEYRHDPGVPMLRCPWHGFEFELATGRSWFDPERTRVKGYEVQLRRREGPFLAETYDVRRRRDELLIEL